MRPLVRAWARTFEALHPGARIEVDPAISLAAGGFRQLLSGRTDLVDFVREPFPAETAAFKRKFGYAPLLINVADGSYATRGGTHAIAVYVNARNPIRGLTLAQLDQILAAHPRGGGRSITTWGALGLRGAWRSRPIHVYGMTPLRASGNPPGIVNFLERRVLLGGTFRADLRIERDRPGQSALQAIVQAVTHDPDGIGYSGFGYAVHGARTVALAEHAGLTYYSGSPKQVAERTYPLSRRIYFALNSPPGRALPALTRAFIEYALSPAGQRQVAHSPDHFLPLTAAQIRRSRRQIDEAVHDHSHPRSAVDSAPYRTADGAVAIVGYNDMREMLEALDALFERSHPGVHFALTLKGTRTAPAALASGRSLLAPMGATFSPAELAAYRRVVGADPVGFRIALDSLERRARSAPLAIFVPADNPVRKMTLGQLRRVFAEGGTRILRWGQLGLGGNWTERPIHPYGLASDTALGRFLRRQALNGRDFNSAFTGLRESTDVVRRVGNDPDGIGFAAMNRATRAVRIVPLARGMRERPSRGSRADVLTGRYPFARYLRIYVRIAPRGRLDPLARQYLRLALSPAGQRAIASGQLGYMSLEPKEAAAERARLGALP